MSKPIVIGGKVATIGGRLATLTEPAAAGYSFLTMEEELVRLGFTNAADRNTIIAKRFATNLVSGGAEYIPADFEIPAEVTYQEGATWVDSELGFEHMIVEDNNTIINCEKHFCNDANITFTSKGSGTTSIRTLRFYRFGLPYNIRGTDSNQLSIDTKLSGDSNGAGNRARNAWFISDSKIAWVSGTNEISYQDIDQSGSTVETLTISFPGSEFISVAQSDAADCRRHYTGPLTEERINTYNAGNTSVQIDSDKVYRIFHVSSDKKSYIVLVYTISTGVWTYLTGTGLSASESASCVVHEIGLLSGTTVDHLTLTASGKGIYSNTDGEGFNYHHIDGTKVVQLYSASNHKGYCTLFEDREGSTEKATPGGSQNTTYNSAEEGDMLMIELKPQDASIVGYPIIRIPTSEPAIEYGGDQNGHPGSRVAVLAGHRDEQPSDDETFSHQIVIMDPVSSNLGSPDEFKYGRFRVANLAIDDTTGGDGDDPGAYMGVDFEHPNFPGRIVSEVYWTASRINHDGTERNFICRTLVPIEPYAGGVAALKTAMASAGYESRQ